ncbi:META domain-containing protein [Croceicoccus sp. F390]|uniref:META domain-containing protein n=1 Tax=Croceicoccus esteveae TaxID=3075597 RepID=A0ABU2ZJM5_9SPHN|nr:META domain-containing protein [Croceicoccus sp. F390]MDT0575612.1 META domain-containing protein [Croceicoccus sp. F390]
MKILTVLCSAIAACVLLAGCKTAAPSPPLATEFFAGVWVVEDIDGRGIIDSSRATLLFAPDGTLSGRATCNHMTAIWRAGDGRVMVEPPALTRMVCAPALMNQEHRFLQSLVQVRRYAIDETGALVLTGEDGHSILARQE